MSTHFDRESIDNAWCPGCGNFAILKILKQAMTDLGLDKREVVYVSGIGQAAKTPHYLDVNMFDGLHGRALPVATGIKMVNPGLIVVAEGGDGDMYGEGGNHFLNAVRRNVNIIHLVHNNMVYGLTKGQASPTSPKNFTTDVQIKGVTNEPFNPISTALALKASFVSRINAGSFEHALYVVKEAFLHRGYALVDIFQPCVTFNSVNTYQWFKEHTYLLEDHGHPVTDRTEAFRRAMEEEKLPIGIFYKNETLPTFCDNLWRYYDKETPLPFQRHDADTIQRLFAAAI